MAKIKANKSSAANKEGVLARHGVSGKLALELMQDMLLYRRYEEKVEESYAIGKIGGFCHLHIGQEAGAAGVIKVL
ncbi:MAG: pyruvate dehydrogenase (acetyl-transferring) E1 component subunit alpha, partial [Gemmatimonadota bacterium]|nr:pyruvate dehydrogenase (acetyl-transferring) E1 component subunit alpha [Gemmatimonadota bacterium]